MSEYWSEEEHDDNEFYYPDEQEEDENAHLLTYNVHNNDAKGNFFEENI
jgi:hypothetical protein